MDKTMADVVGTLKANCRPREDWLTPARGILGMQDESRWRQIVVMRWFMRLLNDTPEGPYRGPSRDWLDAVDEEFPPRDPVLAAQEYEETVQNHNRVVEYARKYLKPGQYFRKGTLVVRMDAAGRVLIDVEPAAAG